MRTFLISILFLAACGQTSVPSASDPPAETAAAPLPAGEPMSTGLMGGYTTSASEEIAAVTFGPDRVVFASADGEETFTVATEFLGVVAPATAIVAGGESFASAAPSATATRVELRRIVGAAPEALCGGMPATHMALVSDEPLTALRFMAFTGADAPGPEAVDSAICLISGYAVD